MAKPVPTRLTVREGRRFGLTVGGAFLVLAGLMVWRGRFVPQVVFGLLGVGLVVAAVAVPRHLGPVQRAWMRLAHAISRVTTPIVLGVVYFLVMMPVGLLLRLLGRNPIRHLPEGNSFWVARHEARGGMTNQF